MTKIAVALMTCDRPAYTKRTVDAFRAMNRGHLDRFVLLHGDDASTTGENATHALSAGFRTVLQHQYRCGVVATRHAMIEIAAQFSEWVLVLENDVEAVRAFPWEMFEYVATQKKVYCLRLFGEYKDAQQLDRAKPTNKWDKNKPVKWRKLSGLPEKASIAEIHWTSQPNVARAEALRAFYRKGTRNLGMTMRVEQNVFVHIGEQRTERVA